jgi:hypothetical protein
MNWQIHKGGGHPHVPPDELRDEPAGQLAEGDQNLKEVFGPNIQRPEPR